ncbi:MAG: hypothetical protein ACI90V_002952 [Bacillariaceae sp.]|jgi:hypothetical protein
MIAINQSRTRFEDHVRNIVLCTDYVVVVLSACFVIELFRVRRTRQSQSPRRCDVRLKTHSLLTALLLNIYECRSQGKIDAAVINKLLPQML